MPFRRFCPIFREMDVDALTTLVNALNLHAKLVYSGGVCGRWLMDHNSETSVWFHLVSKGKGFVHSPSWPLPLALNTGDLVLFLPHAAKHFLTYSGEHLPDTDESTRMASWQEGEAGFVCGEIALATPKSLWWQALPTEIVIRQNQAGPILSRLIELVINEASAQRFGSDSVIERLCDSLFVLVIRYCIEENLVHEGIFAAMQDKRIAVALGLIHDQPWHAWTLAELCTRAGISKSVLSEKFMALIGHSPIGYLTIWRLQIAAHWLREPAMSIERVAERCGYESAAAFSKAFKRHFGVAPGAFRSG
jgi:AraC family transcriptional activator of mtrCDE